jgi:uncharacterized membrane protein YphA (DoxX/SURF4 family)
MSYEDEQKISKELENQRALEKDSRESSYQNDKKKKSFDKIKRTGSVATAFTAIDFSRDAPWLIVIFFSIFADLLTFIPFAGNLFALIFSVFFFFYYLINGHYKNRAVVKIGVTGLAAVLETLGIGINILPFFTASAAINYWLVLTERKNKAKAE